VKKVVLVMLAASLISAGCANTTANPTLVAQPGDDTKTCDGITNEMQQMISVRTTAESDRNKQVASNVALGVAGAFLIVPWFFMDTGNAATVEERAAQARYQRLSQMQIDKKCPAVPSQAATPISTEAKSATGTTTKTDAAAKATSSVEKLETLDSMLKKGLITQEEYNAKKKEILNSM
jgi:Short C-terminal domain